MRSGDTIYALASGPGRAGIAVIRVSGPRAGELLDAIAGGLPTPRRATLRRLRDPDTGLLLDRGLVLWLPGPASFTGEDQAEFHIHGGVAVKAALLSVLGAFEACRPAEPGEFTRRAFAHGRLDLSAVEGLADLVDAETELQRRQALRQAEGALYRLAEDWRLRLIGISASLEAGLDFADEADVPTGVASAAVAEIDALRRSLAGRLVDAARGERVRDGFVVVIAGPPNAGKSTLLNALARRDAAIVSSTPGTTRDLIEIRCDLDGLPVVFVDTAGLREGGDDIEREGMRRARRRMEEADLVLWLTAGGAAETNRRLSVRQLTIATKADLPGPYAAGADLAISAATGMNIPELLRMIAGLAAAAMHGDDDATLTRERHREAVSTAIEALDRAREALYKAREELAAEDVRLAARAIGRITGGVDVEDVLDRIFSQFCIGK